MTGTDKKKIAEIRKIFLQFRKQITTLKKQQNVVIKQAVERIDRQHAQDVLRNINS